MISVVVRLSQRICRSYGPGDFLFCVVLQICRAYGAEDPVCSGFVDNAKHNPHIAAGNILPYRETQMFSPIRGGIFVAQATPTTRSPAPSGRHICFRKQALAYDFCRCSPPSEDMSVLRTWCLVIFFFPLCYRYVAPTALKTLCVRGL